MKFFVAGIPGTGKTFFGDELRDKFGFMHIDLESGLQDLLRGHYRHDLRRFLEEMSQCSRCLVATWGFPKECLSMVQRLSGSDIRLVWFDGDREFARKAWFKAKGRSDDTDFRRQLEAIDNCMEKIKPLFSKDPRQCLTHRLRRVLG
jgi:hypothetical protein